MFRRSLLGLCPLACGCGDDGGGGVDLGSCATDEDCTDGLYCNGEERIAGGCVPGDQVVRGSTIGRLNAGDTQCIDAFCTSQNRRCL